MTKFHVPFFNIQRAVENNDDRKLYKKICLLMTAKLSFFYS